LFLSFENLRRNHAHAPITPPMTIKTSISLRPIIRKFTVVDITPSLTSIHDKLKPRKAIQNIVILHALVEHPMCRSARTGGVVFASGLHGEEKAAPSGSGCASLREARGLGWSRLAAVLAEGGSHPADLAESIQMLLI
jgi:hypothetical protein